MKIIFLLLFFGVFGLLTVPVSAAGRVEIDAHGYWRGEGAVREHRFDVFLSSALICFFQDEGAHSVVDFGCGMGDYVKALRRHHISCEGYDGNPDTPTLSGGVAGILDISQPFDLGKRFEWVLSLEVGEHLPKQYERVFLDNLHRHNVKGIVLSWAVKGQGGFGHFNEQNNEYIKSVMSQYGYTNDLQAENRLRQKASLNWFRNTIMVFRKQ